LKTFSKSVNASAVICQPTNQFGINNNKEENKNLVPQSILNPFFPAIQLNPPSLSCYPAQPNQPTQNPS